MFYQEFFSIFYVCFLLNALFKKLKLEIGAMEVFFTLLFEPAAKISITLALILRMSFAIRKPWNALKKDFKYKPDVLSSFPLLLQYHVKQLIP